MTDATDAGSEPVADTEAAPEHRATDAAPGPAGATAQPGRSAATRSVGRRAVPDTARARAGRSARVRQAEAHHVVVRHVETVPSEARPYQGMRAGVITRTIAAAIDLAVVVAALAATWLAWFGITFMLNPTAFSAPTYEPWMAFGLGWVYALVYLTVAWSTTGRTVGNQLFGLRVVNFRGERLRFVGAAARALFCTVFSVGLFWSAVSRANRSVQDVVLRTSVIYDWGVGPAARPVP